jgi:hypothetical protein
MARRKGNQIPVPRYQSQPVGKDNFKQASKSEFEVPAPAPVNTKKFLAILIGVAALVILLLGLVKR